MYKTSTFLTSVFSKFGVRDKAIRAQIRDLYWPIIESILSDSPSSKRVIIFKELLPTIQVTITYLEALNAASTRGLIDTCAYEALKSNISFNYYLIKKVGIRSDSPSTFSNIMKQVHIDEIACDMGDCIGALRTITDEEERKGVNSQLQVLLNDYNSVTGQDLTIDEILCRQVVVDTEL